MRVKLSKTTWALLVASGAAIVLDVGRGDILRDTGLAYLIWNLFLAWIPYIISTLYIKKDTPRMRFVPLFLLWLLFFPNAPYMVTDIIHVTSHLKHAIWYDALIFFSFAWTALLLGTVSLAQIGAYLRIHFHRATAELAMLCICVLASFGIYLGRFERWNSWDIFTHPSELLHHSYAISTNLNDPTPFMFMAVFTLLIYSAYTTIRLLRSDSPA